MMKFFLVVTIILLAVANAQKGKKGGKAGKGGSSEEIGDGENNAMCAEPEMLGAICVAGTKLGTKLNAAMAKCSGDEEMAKGRARRPIKGLFKKLFKRKRGSGNKKGRGNKKGSGNKKGRGNKKGKGFKGGKGGKEGKCPSFDELVEKIDAETSNSCFENDIHHVGYGLNKPGGNNNHGATGSAKGCQTVCQKTAGCAWFNWVRAGDECWLKTKKGTKTKKMPGDVTGPRTCETDHRCVMKKMGWMDTDGNMVQDVHNADMLTLNKALTDKIDEAEIEECSKNVFEMMSKEHENNKCASSFDEDQGVTLEKIGMQMATDKCAQKVFTALAYLTTLIYSA